MSKEGLVLIGLGAALAILSHPKLRGPLVERLQNEGVITPERVKPEKAEIIKYLGPHLSLLLVGVIIIILGFILL